MYGRVGVGVGVGVGGGGASCVLYSGYIPGMRGGWVGGGVMCDVDV